MFSCKCVSENKVFRKKADKIGMILKHIFSVIKSNNKGISLVELVISAASLCFFALLVNSMLMLGKSFQKSQQNFFDSFQISRMIKQNICMQNATFKTININQKGSYEKRDKVCCVPGGGNTKCTGPCPCKKDNDGQCKKDIHNKVDYLRTFSRKYYKWKKGGSNVPLVGISINNISEPDFKGVKGFLRNPTSQIGAEVEKDTGGKPLYYKVYQDSHTMVKLSMDMAKGFQSGYIFATRCVENRKESTVEHPAGVFHTFDPRSPKQSALYVLGLLDRRPFYFSNTGDDNEKVKCCKNGEHKNTCSSVTEDWVPRIYIIHLESSGVFPYTDKSSGATSKILSANVINIQEMPESQDMNNIWGAGFVLSIKPHTLMAKTTFHLDTIILKNQCSSSVANVQKCPSLFIGQKLSLAKLVGLSGFNMSQFIIPDISSCGGYSSGVDTTSLISF